MLRRLRVRTRLMTVIAVPLVLLLLVAVPEVSQRRSDAQLADRAMDLADDAGTVAAAVDGLQAERLLSAIQRAGSRDVTDALDAQRRIVDRLVSDATTSLRSLEADGSAASSAVEALDALGGLDDVRSATDAAESIVPWVDPFAPLIEALLLVGDQVGAAVPLSAGGAGLSAAALVARSKEAASAQGAQLAASLVWGELRGDQRGILADLRTDELAYRTAYLAAGSGADRAARRAEVQRGAATDTGRAVDAVIEAGSVSVLGSLADWQQASAARDEVLAGVAGARAAEARSLIDALGAQARSERNGYATLMAAGLLLVLLLGGMTARSITQPLERLTDAADDLATERLPGLIDALRNPGEDDERYLAATLEPLEETGGDELGRLSRAFNEVQSVALSVAAEQSSLLRKGISDLYVNLARRNQALIERQIDLLDQLEAGEQDPDVLEHLFLLDHLATRMRRNAESLLVLAGSETGGRRSRPVAVTDVVRAALSEVEAYERVDLADLAGAVVQGRAVSDVAHLLAELLENATHFSPPSTRVTVRGARTGGSYQLMVTDHGIGMPPEQLDALNAVLRDPPVTGLALGRSLGCLVAARLAARHGITVRLRSGEQGITAYVVLPRPLLVEDRSDADEGAGPSRLAARLARSAPLADLDDPEVGPRPAPAPEDWPAVTDEEWPGAPSPAPAAPRGGAPARLVEALPPPAAFDAGLRSLLDPAAPAGLVEPPAPAPAPLPRRVRGASVDAFAPAQDAAPRVRRSPDEVRAMLSRYRSGLQAGRSDDTTTPQEEGS